MAQATTLKFGANAIFLGDGASPELFAAPCGVTSLTLTTNIETNTSNVPDCDDPDLASWLAIDEASRQKAASGSGILTVEALEMWRKWDLAGGPKNVRIITDLAAEKGGGYLEGVAILTAYEETGERGGKWQVSFTVTFDGKPKWVKAVVTP